MEALYWSIRFFSFVFSLALLPSQALPFFVRCVLASSLAFFFSAPFVEGLADSSRGQVNFVASLLAPDFALEISLSRVVLEFASGLGAALIFGLLGYVVQLFSAWILSFIAAGGKDPGQKFVAQSGDFSETSTAALRTAFLMILAYLVFHAPGFTQIIAAASVWLFAVEQENVVFSLFFLRLQWVGRMAFIYAAFAFLPVLLGSVVFDYLALVAARYAQGLLGSEALSCARLLLIVFVLSFVFLSLSAYFQQIVLLGVR